MIHIWRTTSATLHEPKCWRLWAGGIGSTYELLSRGCWTHPSLVGLVFSSPSLTRSISCGELHDRWNESRHNLPDGPSLIAWVDYRISHPSYSVPWSCTGI